MERRTLGLVIWALSAALAVAWLAESMIRGRGFISTYLAPLAIIGNVAGVFLIRSSPRT